MSVATGTPNALEGIRVLDVGGSVATGYCGKLFADHGAHVINAEPAEGFATRGLAPFVEGEAPSDNSALHAYLSTNKSSVVREAPNSTWFAALTRSADVVLASDTFDIEQLQSRNPRVIVNEITWFGGSGPYAGYRGSDAAVQSLAGLVKGIGKPEHAPLLPSGFQAQITGGLTAFIATMTHLLALDMGNATEGARLDTSILEANLCFTEVGAVSASQTGYAGGRWGINRFPPTYPLGIYPCNDGWLGVTNLTPSQWLSFCELLGLDEAAKEPRYLAVGERLQDADKLDPIIASRLTSMSAAELFERGQAMRIPLAPVPTMEELFTTAQYVDRGAFDDVTLPDGYTVRAPVTPFRLFRAPAITGGRVARLGADNASFRGEIRS